MTNRHVRDMLCLIQYMNACYLSTTSALYHGSIDNYPVFIITDLSATNGDITDLSINDHQRFIRDLSTTVLEMDRNKPEHRSISENPIFVPVHKIFDFEH